MLYHIKRFLTCILAFSLLSGCWDRTEVNDVAIVTAIGIDLVEKNSIRMTLLLAVPRLVGSSSVTGGGGGGGDSKLETSAGWIVSEQGKTVMDAYGKLKRKLPREIFFSHNRVIVIGEKLAKKGTLTSLDFFLRNRQSMIKSFILVSKSEAADVLQYKPKFEKLVSEDIKEELKVNIRSSVQLGRFLTMILDSGQEPYAPLISIAPSKNGEGDLDNIMISRGIAVFQDDRLIGWLNDTETMVMLWVHNEMKEAAVVTVKIPEKLGSGYVSAEIVNVHSKISPNDQKGAIKMDIHFSASLNVFENTSKLDLSTSDNKTMLNNLFAQEVTKRIEMLCDKVQKKLRSDILGFGQSIYKHDPQVWNTLYAKNWETLFPDIQVDIFTRIQLIQTGLIGKGTIMEETK